MTAKAIGIGALLGLLSGFFGLGGSSVATPLLRDLLGLAPLLALGTPLPVVVPGSIVAALTYARGGFVNGRVGLWTLVTALPFGVVGSLLSADVPSGALMFLTGLFVAVVGVVFFVQPLLRAGRPRPAGPAARQPRPLQRGRVLTIGAIIGLLSGLLANGGGVLLVPAYVLFLRLATKEAFGTSLVVVIGTALPTSIVHAWLGHVDYALLLPLAIAMIPMAWLGARLTLAIPPARIRQLYGLMLVTLAFFFTAGELRAARRQWAAEACAGAGALPDSSGLPVCASRIVGCRSSMIRWAMPTRSRLKLTK